MPSTIQSSSAEAYRSMNDDGSAEYQRIQLMNFIRSSGCDWTIAELAHEFGWQKSTVSARLNFLIYKTNELEAKPKRLDRVSVKLNRPVGLPAKQRELFN